MSPQSGEQQSSTGKDKEGTERLVLASAEAVVVKVLRRPCSCEAAGQAELERCVWGWEAGAQEQGDAWNKEMGWMVVVWRVRLGVPNALVRHQKTL